MVRSYRGRPVADEGSDLSIASVAGQYAVQGVLNADVNPVLGFVVISAVLSLIIYLMVDLIYFALDPRTRG